MRKTNDFMPKVQGNLPLKIKTYILHMQSEECVARAVLVWFVLLLRLVCFYFVISQNWNTLPEVGKL